MEVPALNTVLNALSMVLALTAEQSTMYSMESVSTLVQGGSSQNKEKACPFRATHHVPDAMTLATVSNVLQTSTSSRESLDECPESFEPKDGRCERSSGLSKSEDTAVRIVAWAAQVVVWFSILMGFIAFLVHSGARGYLLSFLILTGIVAYLKNINTSYPDNLRLFYKIYTGPEVIFFNFFHQWGDPSQQTIDRITIQFPKKCDSCTLNASFFEQYGETLSVVLILLFS